MSDSTTALRVIPYFSPISNTICYIIGTRRGSEAILVDPVILDNEFYAMILKNGFEIHRVLVTHPEPYMRHATRTLCRVFEFQIVCGETDLFGACCPGIAPEAMGKCGLEQLPVHAIPFLPHSRTSYIYRIGNLLFSGAILHAGTLGESLSEYNEELLVAAVKDHLFTLPHADRDMLLLPSVGPPSTIKAEHHLSPYYRERDPSKL